MAILKSTYQGSSFAPNSPTYEITVSLDSAITIADIGTVLPNNGSRFETVDKVRYIPTGSSATIYSNKSMLICTFVAEEGALNATTGYKEGAWHCLAECDWQV